MVGVGYYVARRLPTFDDFMVAGRTMTTPVLICSLVSTYYGLDVLFGTSELGFNAGVVAFFGYSQLSLGVYVFAAFALTERLHRAKFKSLPEIMQRHYGRGSGTFAALASFAYSVPALSLFGLGRISEAVFGVEAELGALVIGGIALAYTLMGGLWAVAITDTIQFVMMCVTLAFAIPLVMSQVGGFDAVAASTPESFFAPLGGIPLGLVIAYAATGISILVDPGFYQRIFAAKHFRQARNAMLMGILVWAAYDWLVTAGGMLGRAAIESGSLPADIHPNDVLLTLVTFALPVGFAGIFLAGTIAAAMSTIDSYSLVAGGNLTYDLYRPLVKPEMSDRQLIRMTKWGIVVSWVLGYLLAFSFERLMALWVFVSTVLVSTVLVPIMMAIFWKGRKMPLAGLLSPAFGLVGMTFFYILIGSVGTPNETFGTYIWSIEIAGVSIDLWQEYAAFFSLPLSLLGFVLGNVFGRTPLDPSATELSA